MVPVCRNGIPLHKQAKTGTALHHRFFNVSAVDQSRDLVAHAAVGLFGFCGEGRLRRPAFAGVAGITGERAEDGKGVRRGHVLLDSPCEGAVAHAASPARRARAAGSDSVILSWVIGMFSPLDERKTRGKSGRTNSPQDFSCVEAFILKYWKLSGSQVLQKKAVSTVARFGGLFFV
jgi:hypothetical protein